MKRLTFIILFGLPIWVFAQERDSNYSSFITTEFFIGKTVPANEGFPDTSPQIGLFANFGRNHNNNPKEWARRLKGPKTGLSVGITNFGNADSLGYGITVMPFLEFKAFRSQRLSIKVGTGGSYFTKKFDPVTNPSNKGITTNIVWSFRAFAHYRVYSTPSIDGNLGMGYFHHSNGHTRLPNQGLNSFLMSLSLDFKNKDSEANLSNEPLPELINSSYYYYSFRAGLGMNVLSEAYNTQKGVYTISGEFGKVFNNTYKLGVGLYYRLYQHYWDYIKDEEFLVRDGQEFSDFKNNPWYNATNLGIHVSGEVFLDHIALELQLGLNFYKEAYKIDWRINQGWDNVPREIPDYFILGEFDSKYRMKKTISSRLGLKYYWFNANEQPKNNWFIGAHINANGGQADFTELSIGFVHNLGAKSK